MSVITMSMESFLNDLLTTTNKVEAFVSNRPENIPSVLYALNDWSQIFLNPLQDFKKVESKCFQEDSEK